MSQFTIPTPILGDISAITINSPDLEASLKYYQRLGFHEVMRADFPFQWIQVTDDALLIMLRKGDDPYLALTYYSVDSDKVAAMLESKEITFASKPQPGDMLKRYLVQSPDGLNVTIVTIPGGFTKPSGKTMLTMDQSDYMKPGTYTNKTVGMWGELAQPVKDISVSIAFWEKLGFSVLSRFESPNPWAILSDGLAIIGLHQSTQFNTIALTFFAADMKDKIAALKKAGLENYTDQGESNTTLTTPEKQTIFLFSMGMG